MKFFFTFLFVCSLITVQSQNQIGINPPGLKWEIFSTEDGRFIYPVGLNTEARKMAAIIDHLRKHDSSVNGSRRTRKIPVILQNHSTLPNGFAIPAPWRMENYLIAPQNQFLGPVEWIDPLTIHEYRHAQQFWQANQGFTRIYQLLMGQTGWLVNSLFSQPLWYREGDAVAAETGFTSAGRGRLPAFHMETRALLLNDIRYNYEKMTSFSYKDFTPNPYRTGYYMTLKGRKDYGDNFWVEVQNKTFRKKGFFQPFSRSMKDLSGYTSKQFYNKTMNELDSIWENDREVSKNYKSISEPDKKYTSYRYPSWISDSTIIAEKSSLGLIRTIVLIDTNGNETKLTHPGSYTGDHTLLKANNSLITWSETRYDERWLAQDYSVIMTYHIKKGKKRQLTHKSRLFAPAPSPDGSKLVAVQATEQQQYNLVVLDAVSGEVLKLIPNPENVFLVHPVWQNDENIIVITQNNCGNAIAQVNIEKGTYKTLVPCTKAVMLRPVASGDFIFFDAAFEKIQNIYAVKISTGDVFQITDAAFGAFDPAVSEDGKFIVFAEYNIDGYSLKMLPVNEALWTKTELNHDDNFYGIEYLEQQHQDITELILPDTIEVKQYNPFFRDLINVYGWFPLPNVPEYGVEFYTLNLMRTLQGTAGVLYNTNENAFKSYGRLTYAALYPVLELEYGFNNRHKIKLPDTLDVINSIDTFWFENTFSAGIRLPFNLSKGIYSNNFDIASAFQLIDEPVEQRKAVRLELNFDRSRARARQHINPRWRQHLNVKYQKVLNGNGEQLFVNGGLYFPGVSRNHTLYYTTGYQQQLTENAYRFSDLFRYGRGYQPLPFDQVWVQSVNYGMPLIYPDLAFGSIAFLQRIRSNVFFDYSQGKIGETEITQRSAGVELLLDMTVFRLAAMSMGPQFSYLFDHPEKIFRFNFLVLYFELL